MNKTIQKKLQLDYSSTGVYAFHLKTNPHKEDSEYERVLNVLERRMGFYATLLDGDRLKLNEEEAHIF